MIPIEHIQFAALTLTGALTLMLVFMLPLKGEDGRAYNRSRWLMVAGTALLPVQFLLQYIGGYRQMGLTQGVFWNLIFFMPCTISINLAILYVQQKGRIDRWDWNIGGVLYLIALALLVITAIADGIPFEQESKPLRIAEYIGSGLYLLMQGHYFFLLYRGYQRMKHAVDEYYDRERNDLLGWMGRSVTMLAAITLFVPFAIFQEGWMLTVFACAFFCIIYYCASCFHSYGISQDQQRVEEAEQSHESDETEPIISEADRQRVEKAATVWAAAGRYRLPNQTLSTVASDMDVQRYMLKAWLQQTKYGKLSNWLNYLRTEDAQRVMTEHPDWSLDAVAEHCGLSLSSFHRVFHQQTGITPAKFLLHH